MNRIRDHMPNTCRPAFFLGIGGLGTMYALYVKSILLLLFGPEVARFLPVFIGATDADQGSSGLSLPCGDGLPAIVLEPDESFIPRPQLVSKLRTAGLRDRLLASRAARLPADFREDTAKGSGGDTHIAEMIVTAEHREYLTWKRGGFRRVRDRARNDRLRTLGVTALLDRATALIEGHCLFGGLGNGAAQTLGVMGGHCQQQDGIVNADRISIVGAPDSAGNEEQGRANGLAFIKGVARSHRHPGQYVARGFGGLAVTCDGPIYTNVLPISRTNCRLITGDRAGIARQMAWAAVSLVVGDVASTLDSRLQDARRHLAGVPDSERRFLMRVGVATGLFSREAVVASATDVLACAVAEYLRDGVS